MKGCPKHCRTPRYRALSIAGQRQTGIRAHFPSPERCPTCSAREKRSCPADGGAGGIFFFSIFHLWLLLLQKPCRKSRPAHCPLHRAGKPEEVAGAGLIFGLSPARLRGSKAGSASSQPRQGNSPMATSPSCHPTSSLSTHPEQMGCKKKGDVSNPPRAVR